jgi:ribonucleoside-diphosphate reductase alpha chain
MRLFITELEGKPFEVFAVIGRAGSDAMAFTEAIGRLISLALRSSIPLELVAEQLRGIGGSSSAGFGPNRVRSVPDAIGKLLEEHYLGKDSGPPSANGHAPVARLTATQPLGEICPICQNATLVNEEGCRKCHSCGHSEC